MVDKFKERIKGSTILITGGTGSFGNSVVKTLIEYSPKRIVIFSRDETKQFFMRNSYDNPILRFVIGDVRDKESVDAVTNGIDYIFHAAALKQVPSCEFFPMEAVKTNILGTFNVIQSALENRVKRVVVLSTDKAAYPINAMGMSKALMEKVMIAASRNIVDSKKFHTILCGVRYGNVLYSRGSVLPYFVEQALRNKRLLVTNPEMTRFLLPLSTAVDLVLYALSEGENGYMYVRKSPACTIGTLADAVRDIFDSKEKYKEVGVRAGEKMHETLVSKEEMSRATDIGNYYKIRPESQGLEYNRYFFEGNKIDVNKVQPYTSENTKRLNLEKTSKLLLNLPEIQELLKPKNNEK